VASLDGGEKNSGVLLQMIVGGTKRLRGIGMAVKIKEVTTILCMLL
jgi:hypothetical protein